MTNADNICNTCVYKSGRTLVAPISTKKVPIYSCSTYPLAQGYDYENNNCGNYKKEVDDEP